MGAGGHVTPFNVYVKVLSALLVLTVVTVYAAQFDFGILNTFIAMLIASIKASIVAIWFMHLKGDDKFHTVILISGVFFLIVMFAFSYLDIISRLNVESTL